MNRYEGSPAVIIERRKGTPDSPFNNMNESLVVTGDGKVLLSEIPNELNRVIVTSDDNTTWYEIKEGQITENAFKVDYINKLVTFNTIHVGKQLHFKYVGEGNHYYSPHSIYTKLEDKTVVETLGDIVEGGKHALDALGALNEKLDEVTQATNNAKEATNDAITTTNDASDVIVRGEKVIVDATAKINEMDDKIVEVNDKLHIADTKLKEVDDALLEVDNTIQNANQSIDNLNAVIDDAVQTTNNAQLLIDEAKSVGEFVLTRQYKKNNTVLHNGSTWIALQDTKDNPLPILPVTENTYWRLVAQRGVDGNGSVSSVNGVAPDIEGNVELDFGAGTVKSVNEVQPDEFGNVDIKIPNSTLIDEIPYYHASAVYPEGITVFTVSEANMENWISLVGENEPVDRIFVETTNINGDRGWTVQTIKCLATNSLVSMYVRIFYRGRGQTWQTPVKVYPVAGGTGVGNSFFVPYSLVTTEEYQKSWSLPVGSYDGATDSLMVFHNAAVLDPNYWTITGTVSTGYTVNIPDNPITAIEDNNVLVMVLKNTPSNLPEDISGTRLTEGSVGLTKLSQDAQDAINNAGNADAVKQWVKNHGLGGEQPIIAENKVSVITESGMYTVISLGKDNVFLPKSIESETSVHLTTSVFKNSRNEISCYYVVSYYRYNIEDDSFSVHSVFREKGITYPSDDTGWFDAGDKVDIIPTIDSDRTDAALSASAGKVLNQNITTHASKTASMDELGHIKPDGTTITVAPDGTVSAKQVELVTDFATGGNDKAASADLTKAIYDNHINKNDIHVTAAKKAEWDGKLDKTGGTITSNLTVNGTLIVGGTDLKQSVSDGKALVANAITGKGVSTSTTAEFATMANNIKAIPVSTGKQQVIGTFPITVPANSEVSYTVSNLAFVPKNACHQFGGAVLISSSSMGALSGGCGVWSFSRTSNSVTFNFKNYFTSPITNTNSTYFISE